MKKNYLELVNELMELFGLDEDTACREASAELYPETYDATTMTIRITIFKKDGD